MMSDGADVDAMPALWRVVEHCEGCCSFLASFINAIIIESITGRAKHE